MLTRQHRAEEALQIAVAGQPAELDQDRTASAGIRQSLRRLLRHEAFGETRFAGPVTAEDRQRRGVFRSQPCHDLVDQTDDLAFGFGHVGIIRDLGGSGLDVEPAEPALLKGGRHRLGVRSQAQHLVFQLPDRAVPHRRAGIEIGLCAGSQTVTGDDQKLGRPHFIQNRLIVRPDCFEVVPMEGARVVLRLKDDRLAASEVVSLENAVDLLSSDQDLGAAVSVETAEVVRRLVPKSGARVPVLILDFERRQDFPRSAGVIPAA